MDPFASLAQKSRGRPVGPPSLMRGEQSMRLKTLFRGESQLALLVQSTDITNGASVTNRVMSSPAPGNDESIRFVRLWAVSVLKGEATAIRSVLTKHFVV